MQVINATDWSLHCVEEITNPERYLAESAEILNSLGVKWCFGFGTAIGFYRDGDFPQRDTDVDILVFMPDGQEEALDRAFQAKYRLIRTVRKAGIVQQLAYQGEDGYIVDISFCYKDGDNYVSQHEEGNFVDKCDTIGNFCTIDTKYGAYPFPEKIEDYLETRYGDWRTPRYGAINSSTTQ